MKGRKEDVEERHEHAQSKGSTKNGEEDSAHVKMLEKKEFLQWSDELRDEILQELATRDLIPKEAIDWLRELIDYNCKDGKLNRGLSVIHCTQVMMGERFTKDVKKRAGILGLCIEWLQAFFLVADDVMDESITRRGKPCWYKLPKVKQIAINDSFLLESFVFQILKRHFRADDFYVDIVELFHEVIYQTELGQLLDLTAQPLDGAVELDRFTVDRHRSIVVYKTAFYTFYLPVACAMILSGISGKEEYETAKKICIKIGEYFQVQDDYLDCYGAPEVIGKIGTDIQDSKCSWLVVQALAMASEEQKQMLKTNYGKSNSESIAIVKKMYSDLDLESLYRKYESESYIEIVQMIDQVRNMPTKVFQLVVDKIYKRKM